MKYLAILIALLALLLEGCASLNTPAPAWNIKEIKTGNYVARVNRSANYQALSRYLGQKGLKVSILEQDSDGSRGALAGIYADGLYYNFTDEDTARHIRERTGNLIEQIMGELSGSSEWVITYCIDFTNGTANVDMSSIKADLYYSLSRMTIAHQAARPHNLGSCTEDNGVPVLYRAKVRLAATFDGARTGYTVVNPAQPLKEIERFDLTLTDLTYQASETILTDPKLLESLQKATEALPNLPAGANGMDRKDICNHLKLDPGSAAYKECIRIVGGSSS